MKKIFLSLLVAVAISTTIKAQTKEAQPGDSVKYNGFIVTVLSHKMLTIVCRPQIMGYIDSSQSDVTHNIKYSSKVEFHTKNAYEQYTETLTENKVKTSVDATVSFDYGTESGSVSAGFETDYFNKLLTTIKSTSENSTDKIEDYSVDYAIKYEPHKSIELYECVETIPGEYERTYTWHKVDNQKLIIPYKVIIDYSTAVRKLYEIIKGCNVGTDTGEWSKFNQIAAIAFSDYENPPLVTWKNFLTSLSTELWTGAEDQGSWSIVKNAAADALKRKEPFNQFRHFCADVTAISDPSHNDWAWKEITDFAKQYE